VEGTADGLQAPEPATVLGAGRVDAVMLLALWLVRRAFWLLMAVGILVLVALGSLDSVEQLETPEITSAAQAREVLLSAQGVLLVAPLLRLVSGWLALLLAYPHARRFQRSADRAIGRTARHPAVWWDRWHLVRALRDWRWTSSVRRHARWRLGRASTPILVADLTLLILGLVLLPVSMIVLIRSLV
jgi:hypothetical protein